MAGKTLEIRFPSAGVDRRMGFRDSLDRNAPYPTPWAVNVRPEDPLAQRLRGGSRPGLTAYGGSSYPTYSTGVLQTEAGVDILTEDDNQILLPIVTSSVSRPLLVEAIDAYGIDTIPEDIEASIGTAPTGYSLGCRYRDRLVLAVDAKVHFSRQGDYTDWDYGAELDDTGRAVLVQLAEAGELGDTVTAAVPHKDAYLLIATAHGLWLMHGDPTTGSLRNVSRDIGIVSSRAWTKVGDTVFFLSDDGLYSVSADGSNLKPLSPERLPVNLKNTNTASVTVLLGYNQSERGVYIFLVGGTYHWYYDLVHGGFWPFQLSSSHNPTGLFFIDGVLSLKCSDGNYRSLGGDDDAGTDIESHVLLGPFRLGGSDQYGMIPLLHGVMADSSGAVTWRIVDGETAEEACENGKTAIGLFQADNSTYSNYVTASGEWAAGRSHSAYPRARAMWAVLWLQSTEKWAYETIAMNIQKSGRWR